MDVMTDVTQETETTQVWTWFGTPEAQVRRDWTWMDRYYREALQDGRQPSLHIPFRPSSERCGERGWDAALGDWDETQGVCPDCHMMKALSGACGC